MRDRSRSRISSALAGEDGGILVAALLVTLFVTMAVIAGSYETGVRLRAREEREDAGVARVAAQAALEDAVTVARENPTWRSSLGTGPWITGRVLDRATYDVSATDPHDGAVEVDGSFLSSDADTVRWSVRAAVGPVAYRLEADYVPLPDSLLRCVVFSGADLDLQNVIVEGRVRANGNVTNLSGAQVAGDITVVSGASVSPELDDDDTDIRYVPGPTSLPAVDTGWFVAAGEEIVIPLTRAFISTSFSTVSNPFGVVSPEGIYWMDAGGGDVLFLDCGIQASITILNAGIVRVGGLAGVPTFYYHESPRPTKLPAMVVEGNLSMAIDGSGNVSVVLPFGTILLPSALHGVFYATGDFDGPQVSSVVKMPVDGAFLSGGRMIVRGSTDLTILQHDPRLNLNPIVEMASHRLRLLPGTTREP